MKLAWWMVLVRGKDVSGVATGVNYSAASSVNWSESIIIPKRAP